MRREGFSFLEISQDPLLTILALVLMSTMWLMLPGESRGGDTAALQDRKQSLEKNLGRLIDEEKRMAAHEQTGRDDVRQFAEQIATLQREIDRRSKELETLEIELKTAQQSADPARASSGTLALQVEALKREIETKQRELEALRQQVEVAKRKAAEVQTELDRKRADTARLQNEVLAKKEELEKLRKRPDASQDRPVIRGTEVFSSTKPKTTHIRLIGNRLYPVDDEYFRVIESGYIDEGGQRVPARRLGLNPSAAGDDVQSLSSAQSALSKTLKKLDPRDTRILLLVHGDSFEILRKAREVAAKQGFEVGWWPHEDETLVMGGRSLGDSTPPSSRRPPQ